MKSFFGASMLASMLYLSCALEVRGAGLEPFGSLDEAEKREFIEQFQAHIFDYQNVDDALVNEVVA